MHMVLPKLLDGLGVSGVGRGPGVAGERVVSEIRRAGYRNPTAWMCGVLRPGGFVAISPRSPSLEAVIFFAVDVILESHRITQE